MIRNNRSLSLVAIFTLCSISIFARKAEQHRWSATGAFLYWYADEEGIGCTNKPANILVTDNFTRHSVIAPPTEWEPGVRLGTSYTLPKRLWTFQAYWTYLKSQAHDHKRVDSNTPHFQGIYPIWSMGPETLAGDYVSSASLNWHLHTNIADLYAQYNGSYYHNRLIVMPFLGVRGSFLNQKLKASYEGGSFSGGIDENHLKSRYSSGGPRFGLQLNGFLTDDLSLWARGAITPLFGSLSLEQQETYLGTDRFHRSRTNYHFVLSTDYELGLRWQRAVFEEKLGIVLGISWEGQEFFYADSFYRGRYRFFKKHRSLFLQGLTFYWSYSL